MSNQEKARGLLTLFDCLREILLAEGEGSRLRGINLICNALTPPFAGEDSIEGALRYAEATYKSMLGGSGSFSDFYIWRDDFDDRVKVNNRLEQIKGDIWDTFGE